MLNKSQSEIANELGLTFQQLQKYEKGSNRVSASRLQALSAILQVPVSFFFEGVPEELKLPALGSNEQSPSYVDEFLATPDGVALAMAFGRIRKPRVRRAIVALVERIVVEPPSSSSALNDIPTHRISGDSPKISISRRLNKATRPSASRTQRPCDIAPSAIAWSANKVRRSLFSDSAILLRGSLAI
jgi:transcriptional regulator with XRE-family HTH domain